MKYEFKENLDGSCELFEALTAINHAKNFLGNKTGIFLMTIFPNDGKSRPSMAHMMKRRRRTALFPRELWIDCLTSSTAHRALRPDGKKFSRDPNMELCVRRVSGPSDARSEQQEYKKPEPSYDLSSSSSHKKQDHQDEEQAQPGYRMRRPAPPSVKQERKVNLFSKIPVTVMFYATYGNRKSAGKHPGPGNQDR